MNTQRTKKLAAVAMLSAVAYIVMVVGRIPVVLFLKYDPKDVVITLCGLIYGPLAAVACSLTVSVVEMFTASDTGPIGLVMNVLSSCTFACTAAWIYRRKRTLSSAVVGLAAGGVAMTAAMMLWNALITPFYMGIPRGAVLELLIPAFLPFNLLKGGLNAAITMLLYKPLVSALRRSGLLPPSASSAKTDGRVRYGVAAASLLVVAAFALMLFAAQGVL